MCSGRKAACLIGYANNCDYYCINYNDKASFNGKEWVKSIGWLGVGGRDMLLVYCDDIWVSDTGNVSMSGELSEEESHCQRVTHRWARLQTRIPRILTQYCPNFNPGSVDGKRGIGDLGRLGKCQSLIHSLGSHIFVVPHLNRT